MVISAGAGETYKADTDGLIEAGLIANSRLEKLTAAQRIRCSNI